jgi:hypothetical protein
MRGFMLTSSSLALDTERRRPTGQDAVEEGTKAHEALDAEAPNRQRKPLEGLPDSHPDWRVNNEALRPIAANSPLETRQQRRAASKALARGLATSGKLKEREARVMERKRRRADEAAARYHSIANHVPSTPAD